MKPEAVARAAERGVHLFPCDAHILPRTNPHRSCSESHDTTAGGPRLPNFSIAPRRTYASITLISLGCPTHASGSDNVSTNRAEKGKMRVGFRLLARNRLRLPLLSFPLRRNYSWTRKNLRFEVLFLVGSCAPFRRGSEFSRGRLRTASIVLQAAGAAPADLAWIRRYARLQSAFVFQQAHRVHYPPLFLPLCSCPFCTVQHHDSGFLALRGGGECRLAHRPVFVPRVSEPSSSNRCSSAAPCSALGHDRFCSANVSTASFGDF
jgi:hypothetical protein